jgi:putative Mn2+ efflux pump MntP
MGENSDDLELLHKSIKHLMEIAFAVSPLLALSTHGWFFKSVHSAYLLRVRDYLACLLLLFINKL